MIMRAFPLLFTLACLGCVACVQAQLPTDPPISKATKSSAQKIGDEMDGLKISISPTAKGNGGNAIKLLPKDPQINVVLQNTSSKPLNIFEEWNSWGAYNLTLKVTKIDGKVLQKPLIISNLQTAWLKNFDSVETIQPAKAITREVHLQVPTESLNPRRLYGKFPFPKEGHSSQITMSAVFANDDPKSDTSREKKVVWTGKIASPPTNYRVYWGVTSVKTVTP
ncbi:hypothetical protein IAD21_05586 [Abditibacteriota bacterium]|nr:hypothetical protein IAD21_05586 [Abditibacteriota bacterium]